MRNFLEKYPLFAEENDIVLNEMLSAEQGKEGELWLHVEDVRDEELKKKLSLLRNGFKKLASRLKSDKALEKVKFINATSWIVAKNPKFLENLGFTITTDPKMLEIYKKEYKDKAKLFEIPEEFKNLELGHAYISRNRFVELYG